MNSIREVALPHGSSIALYSAHADFSDAYSVPLTKDSIHNPELLAKFIFEQQASWIMGLMGLRDKLVKLFRLEISTVEGLQKHDIEGVSRVGFFKVYGLMDNEIIMGEDDHHLDFRVSVLYRNGEPEDGSSPHVIISTVVLCHNRLGRNYLRLIKPFHRVIVKSGLRRAVVKGFPKQI
jgi:hypothetical protein